MLHSTREITKLKHCCVEYCSKQNGNQFSQYNDVCPVLSLCLRRERMFCLSKCMVWSLSPPLFFPHHTHHGKRRLCVRLCRCFFFSVTFGSGLLFWMCFTIILVHYSCSGQWNGGGGERKSINGFSPNSGQGEKFGAEILICQRYN